MERTLSLHRLKTTHINCGLWKGKGFSMENLREILEQAAIEDASDIFLIAGLPVTVKEAGRQKRVGSTPLMPNVIGDLIAEAYRMAGRDREKLDRGEDDDFSLSLPRRMDGEKTFAGGRFRINVFHQRGSLAAVIRVIHFELPDPVALGIPREILALADAGEEDVSGNYGSGLILLAGATGTGKSTTLACMVDYINMAHDCHIITLEDPIEYIHRHKKAIVSQREIFIDTPGYPEALRSALRESPDVILLGEMRDYETISAAMTAAEAGVLVLSTVHTNSAADTISRIIDVFPDKANARIQLALTLRAVVCQQLVPSAEKEDCRIPAFEIMKATEAVQNLIRENKLNQLTSVMQSGAADGMRTMDGSLLEMYKQGKISKAAALKYRIHYGYEYMEKRLG